MKLIQNDPVSFLQKKVFKKYSKKTAAVGFKLFYYHAWEDSRKAIWSFLKQQKELKIIHIKRINTLKQLLSEKIALKSNIWTNYTGEHEEKMSVEIDYDECLEMFIRVQKERDQGDTYFKNHDKIDVVYEDLSTNHVREVKRIQEFLNVANENLKPNTHKQAHQPLHEAILNYSSLKKRFKGTPWYAFFED